MLLLWACSAVNASVRPVPPGAALPARCLPDLHWRDPIPERSDTLIRDSLRFPIRDHRLPQWAPPLTGGLDLRDPSQVRDSVEYLPGKDGYLIRQTIGGRNYRPPYFMSRQEFLRRQGLRQEERYWMQRAEAISRLNYDSKPPELYRGPRLFNRIFGGTQADIRPQGNVNLTFGYEGQNYKNLTLPERARKTGGFNFNMDINLNVEGKIGNKLKLSSSYNTQSVFDFEKQIKLEYTGDNDEIIKKIEAGNVSFPLRTQLITGVQSLFGIKTQLEFGRLTVTSVLSNQRSQKQSLMIQGGSQTQTFAIQADQYEENRHFLLAQYFYDHYNETMARLPIVNSQVHIIRIEVWVTNKTGTTTNARDIVGLMDLGENNPYNANVHSLSTSPLPENGANDLYSRLASDPAARNSGMVTGVLMSMGLQPVQDFEKTYARKLDSTEYSINRDIGYISINHQLQPDEVLAVAYQYTYNGRVYQVGEFSQDVTPDSLQAQPQVLFLKLLKATSARPGLPIWKLMMKNIYNTGAFQIARDNFKMDIFYQDPGGGEKRYLPAAQGAYRGEPLLSILNLDRLNNQNDPQPDGVFDFIDGYTINSQTGRIIFPVLEPFGKDLAKALGGNAQLDSQYLYQVLYDSTKTIAQQFPQYDRYILRGSFKSSSSSSIFLGASNIPPGSVTVTAGGQVLIENVDYSIDYATGQLTLLNQGILNSGLPIKVQYENNNTFGQQTRNYFGTRLDYAVSDKLSLGATVIRMTERPYFNIVNYGEDPINNTMAGMDLNYQSELPGLTHWLDKLPNYATTAASTINARGEVAKLFPGHSSLIGKGSRGTIYLDDFEGASSEYDLRFPSTSWVLASTPQGATDANGNVMFPEATFIDSLPYGENRALLAWYTIEQSLADGGSGTPDYIRANKELYLGHYVRLVQQQQVFPNKSVDFGQGYLSTFDLAYYPRERGPYNFVTSSSQINANGHFLHPEQKWGGIMRALDNTDFEAANYQYIDFWVMDPFLDDPTSQGGDLYINLGNVSEDILRDGQKSFENGLPNPADVNKVDTTVWGRIAKFQIQLTNAFDNNPAARAYQDVGYDGLSDAQERSFRQSYLQTLERRFGSGSEIYQEALSDPDNDDYHFYRGSDLDNAHATILERYKRYNGSDGDSPISSPNQTYSSAATNYPETEDINHDNTLNESEEYFQYRVHLTPGMQVGQQFVVDKIVVPANSKSGPLSPETWYEFRIPIDRYDKQVGDIQDFKSIRFIRMFLTHFSDSVVLRFAKLGLVRNQWRTYNYQLNTPGQYVPIDNNSGTSFDVSSVNLEENATRSPIPYVIPPGIQRQSQLSTNNVNLYLNEQSMSLRVDNLQDGQARGVFKNLGLDLRQYHRLQMFIHAESILDKPSAKDGQLQAVIRLGSDFVNNYYEYRIPLKITDPHGPLTPTTIWPAVNDLDLDLSTLPQLKEQRNLQGVPLNQPFTTTDAQGHSLSVVGNPSLGDVREVLIGILNPKKDSTNPTDDGAPKSAEIWVDELRVSDMNEKGGYAATGRVDLQLADLGSLSMAGSMHTPGFGSIDQGINDRYKDSYRQYDVATSLELGKLLPSGWRLSIPLYAGYSQTRSLPEYDPYDLDISLKQKLQLAGSRTTRDSILQNAETFTSIKSLNLTNMRVLPDPNQQRHHLWDIENFNLSYSFSQILEHDPLILSDLLTRQRLGLGYAFNGTSRFLTPLRGLFHSRSRLLNWIEEFNVNPVPSLIGVRAELDRQFGTNQVRNIGGAPFAILPTYDKYFTYDRYYNLRWDLARSLSLDFEAINNGRIDEPYGRIDTRPKKDTVWNNLLALGRTTLYQQTASLNYTVPLNRLALLDWTNIHLGYATSYQWTAASLLARELGNIIQNTSQRQINAEFNLNGLYNKWPFLRKINTSAPAASGGYNRFAALQHPAASSPASAASGGVNPLLKALIRPLLMVKRVSLNYSENGSTVLPGFTDSTKYFGQNWARMAPGMRFAFGWQAPYSWLNQLGHQGLLSRDSTFNLQFQQVFTQRLDAQASLEPLSNLHIDLSLTKSFSKTHSELFKDTTGHSGFAHLNPYDAGGFEITFIALKTLFDHTDPQTGARETFLRFEQDRSIISQRLGQANPYTKGRVSPSDPLYDLGYGKYAQDVLIPAFLAAYTGTDPSRVSLLKNNNSDVRSNPFSNIHALPNWRVSYNGLSNLPLFANILSNLNITHAYSALLDMNSFTSALLYMDPLNYGYPGFIDSVSGNYIPYFLVPNITITEQFNPLLGLDATFTNNLNLHFSYGKGRTLSLSLIDFQLSEVRSTDISFGAGYRVRNLQFAFLKNNGKKVSNDLNFRVDLGLQNFRTVNNQLDANLVIPTSGQEVITISPSIDYVVNDRLNLHFFYDKRQTIPAISTSYPISNTEAGVTLRFILTQ